MSSADNDHQDYELASLNGVLSAAWFLPIPLKSHIPMPGGHPSRGEPDFGDSSWPLFTMYSKIAEEDNKRAQLWHKDAEGIIVFVCPSIFFHDCRVLIRKLHLVERVILCRRRHDDCCINPGSQT